MPDILFLAHRIPFPPDRGDKIRSFHALKHLAGLGRVHLACFADDEADAGHLPALREALGNRLGEAHVEVRRTGKAAAAARALLGRRPVSLTAFDSPSLRRFVQRIAARPGLAAVFAFSGQMGQFVPAGPRFVMDFCDMDSAKFAAYAKSGPVALRWLMKREAEMLFAFERETAARADASLFVSEAEADLFRSRTGLADVRAMSNGIDLDFFDPDAAFPRLAAEERGLGPLLLFTGQMDYRPNIEAVTAFARHVLPLLPGVRFAVAGRKPAPQVVALRGQGVLVTGEVADIRSWLAAADVVVAPLGIARGIQNKVLEAMALARPVVASPAAFEGIEAEPGRELIVAESGDDQAQAIARLLGDPKAARALGAAARVRMESSYRWDSRLAPLERMLFPAARKAAA
ncbi:TIGR03087 family PEP-CTERM/XrtA system glycosyltransferase [Allosphingosinicella sp.]|uniref:TIGR03087 family PEP-CTERM/XrtA system glycosyltransferase n=1 Tax=Allosphingosinicella sp. TaxID=2823234 RepID=UPI003D743FC6